MSVEDEVRKASEQFYAALNALSISALDGIWSHSETVTIMHPLGGRQLGWNQVRASWEQVTGGFTEMHIKLADQLIRVAGDMAYELGVEQGQGKFAGQVVTFNDRVTNVYRREAGAWKMVHHHTDISAAMVDIMSHLQAKK